MSLSPLIVRTTQGSLSREEFFVLQTSLISESLSVGPLLDDIIEYYTLASFTEIA